MRTYGKEFKTIDPHYWEKRYIDDAPYNVSVFSCLSHLAIFVEKRILVSLEVMG